MVVREPINKAEFDKLLDEAGQKLVVVDFFATWCGPCKIVGPKFVKISDEFDDEVFCIKVDTDKHKDLTDQYEINVMPTFVFIRNKKIIIRLEGNNINALRKAIKDNK